MDNFVQVAVRMRPLTFSEKEENIAVHWKIEAPSCIYSESYPSKVFTLKNVFTEKDDNEVIYSKFCSPIVQSVVKGFNGAIVAYGQISSGKTFTMMGDDDIKIDGIIHFSIYDLFKLIEDELDILYFIRIACLEVHNGKMRDLLCDSNENLHTEEKMGRNNFPLVTRRIVQRPQEIFNYIREAQKKIVTKCTLENKNSSGSSLIIDLTIESYSPKAIKEKTVETRSHLCFVDLAGTSEDFERNKIEPISNSGQKIMMNVKTVIQHLAYNKGKSQSIIREEAPPLKMYDGILCGNIKTAIICTVSPTNLHETYAYLEIAVLARLIPSRPEQIRIDFKYTQLARYTNQVRRLLDKMRAAEKKSHLQCRNIEIKLMNLERLWLKNFLCISQPTFDECFRKKISDCTSELRYRKSLPQQPFIYRFCSRVTNESKKRV